jgi:hypothetical protein
MRIWVWRINQKLQKNKSLKIKQALSAQDYAASGFRKVADEY